MKDHKPGATQYVVSGFKRSISLLCYSLFIETNVYNVVNHFFFAFPIYVNNSGMYEKGAFTDRGVIVGLLYIITLYAISQSFYT